MCAELSYSHALSSRIHGRCAHELRSNLCEAAAFPNIHCHHSVVVRDCSLVCLPDARASAAVDAAVVNSAAAAA
jgi:hypothetical protein